MHCASCVARVEKALRVVEGVEDASVNLTTGRADVDGRGLVADTLIDSVQKAGYQRGCAQRCRVTRLTPLHPLMQSVVWFSRSDAFQRAAISLPACRFGVMALQHGGRLRAWSPWVAVRRVRNGDAHAGDAVLRQCFEGVCATGGSTWTRLSRWAAASRFVVKRRPPVQRHAGRAALRHGRGHPLVHHARPRARTQGPPVRSLRDRRAAQSSRPKPRPSSAEAKK